MIANHEKYEVQNIQQFDSESDPFTLERYKQFSRFLPQTTREVKILDIGCNTGRGGQRLKELKPSITLCGLDCVQARLATLPSSYAERVYGLSTQIPTEDLYFDGIVAGEFIEHLYPADVDKTLCEFNRVLKIGGKLLLTTPNPNYLKSKILGQSVYGVSHLTQHFPKILKHRLLMHGFSQVRIYGSGKMSRYLGWHFPILSAYGSYLAIATKF